MFLLKFANYMAGLAVIIVRFKSKYNYEKSNRTDFGNYTNRNF